MGEAAWARVRCDVGGCGAADGGCCGGAVAAAGEVGMFPGAVVLVVWGDGVFDGMPQDSSSAEHI